MTRFDIDINQRRPFYAQRRKLLLWGDLMPFCSASRAADCRSFADKRHSMSVVLLRTQASSRGARMLRTALGREIEAWLSDASVIEVMLNPDGRLWIDRLGSGIADTGRTMSAETGERIIRLVAHHVGAEAHGGCQRVSAELPDMRTGKLQGVITEKKEL